MFKSLLALGLSFLLSTTQALEWNEQELRILKSLSLQALPDMVIDPSNSVTTSTAAIKLGEKLFFDARLSGNGKTACASCHQPQRVYTDGLKTAKSRSGTGTINRNTPTLIGVAHQDWFYWDGRRDSLWSQAITPIEAQEEMANNRLSVAKLIINNASYQKEFSHLFGDQDHLLIRSIQASQAGPFANNQVKSAWATLSYDQQRATNRLFSQVGKVIAAFISNLRPKPSLFDRFVSALSNTDHSAADATLNQDQQAGLKLFINSEKTRCLQCHNGPLFSNGGFHNIGTGSLTTDPLDFGRAMGREAVLLDEFNCLGEFSDAQKKDCTALRFLSRDTHPSGLGAYKTPSLRGLKYTAPYFHDGRINTLSELIAFYTEPPIHEEQELKPIHLTEKEKQQLIAFLNSL